MLPGGKRVMTIILAITAFVLYLWVAHHFSYRLHKKILHNEIEWDLNICCGKTDVGKINVDIIKHKELKHFCLVEDIYHLPFKNRQFKTVLCSHTMEHVESPLRFLKELMRVSEEVTVILPPLYDISAAFNPFIHKWVFLTFKKKYVNMLPPHIVLPGSRFLHKHIGQVKNA